MKSLVLALIVASFFIMLGPALAADAPTPIDVVTVKDVSIIYGEVVEMAGEVLQIKTAASPVYRQSLSDDVRICL